MSTLSDLSSQLADTVAGAEPSVLAVRGPRHTRSAVAWSETLALTTSRGLRRGTERELVDASGANHVATVVGRDRSLGLALLRVDAGGLAPLTWSSAEPRVGGLVVAVSRGESGVRATLGMVSAVGGGWRTRWGGTVARYLEVDGTLPRGGSGGPLLDAGGAAIGLNTAGLLPGGTTLPHETLAHTVASLQRTRADDPGYLGLSTVPVEPPGHTGGLLVVRVDPDGPCAAAGVLLGDVLLSVGGHSVSGVHELVALLAQLGAGAEAPLELLRGGEPLTVPFTLTKRP